MSGALIREFRIEAKSVGHPCRVALDLLQPAFKAACAKGDLSPEESAAMVYLVYGDWDSALEQFEAAGASSFRVEALNTMAAIEETGLGVRDEPRRNRLPIRRTSLPEAAFA